MLAELWIGEPSSESNLRLLAGGEGWPEYFLAQLKASGLSCRARVSTHDPSGCNQMSRVFAEMNQSWKGWEGEKVWRSTDGELELKFSMSATGAIRIDVRLRDSGMCDWKVATTLAAQSGDELSRLARQAARFQAMLDEVA